MRHPTALLVLLASSWLTDGRATGPATNAPTPALLSASAEPPINLLAGRAASDTGSRDAPGQIGGWVLRSTSVIGGRGTDDLGWLRSPRFGGDGRLYFAGTTRSPDFPIAPGTGSQSYQGGNEWGTEDVFLGWYDPATRAIDCLGLLGGAQGPEFVADLQIDPRGYIHLVGNTGSADYPMTADAAQSKFAGPRFRHADGCLTVVAPAGGGIEYSSFFGGAGNDWLLRLFLDPDGSATVFGITDSPDLLPPDRTLRAAGLTAAPALFVAQLDARDRRLVVARILANCWDAAVERLESGDFVVAGTTNNPAFPATASAFDRSYNGGSAEAGGDLFVLKLSGDLNAIQFATLFGGRSDEFSPRLATLPNGEILLGGWTTSADLPVTTGKRDGAQEEGKQLFLTRLTPDGSRVAFCDTLTAAHPTHRLGAMAHDGKRRLVFVGTTESDALPFTPIARQSRLAGDSDAFLLVFDTDENAVVQCTLLGGSGSDTANALAWGRDGRLFVLGTTESDDFPARTGPSRQGQGSDVYVAEFALDEHVGGVRDVSEPYLGQPPPGATPVVFAPGIVSTDATNEHSAPTFSPDGDEVFWLSNRPPGPDNQERLSFCLTARRENGQWSAPRPAPFEGMAVFSVDGRRVYFHGRNDLWTIEKQGNAWSEPRCLRIAARFPELKAIYMPTVTRSGTLYFIGHATGVRSNFGIYRAELVDGDYAQPQLLPRSINLPPFLNWAPFVAPDESYLLFSSNRRDPDHDGGDLYISRRQPDGSWSEPISLGAPVNSTRQDVFPGVSPGGKYLFFCRDTPGRRNDVYWVDAASVSALHPTSKPPAGTAK